jgi:hypothetical protein
MPKYQMNTIQICTQAVILSGLQTAHYGSAGQTCRPGHSGGAAQQEAASGGVGACARNKIHTEQNLNYIIWACCLALCVLLLRTPVCVDSKWGV